MRIDLTVNQRVIEQEIHPGESLLELLRRLGFVGVKNGCEAGDCGACTVLLNGRAVNACLVFAAKAHGSAITTVEGLAEGETLHPAQQAYLDEGAVQCGYCTPGMLMTTIDLLSRNPTPNDDEIRHAIAGNLCRCTGYEKQVVAIRKAAEAMKGGSS
jgi:carbon-monoxide dehydrogenase small subunit